MSSRYQAGIVLPGYNALKVPNAPTIGTASPVSTTSLSITFTAPSDVGGGAITSYIATAKRTSDGVLFSASGASSPITITGLTAVPFTVTVVAVNAYGPSAASTASNSVTPAIPPPTVIGQAYEGGFYAGQIGVSSVATHYLVVGPVASAQNSSRRWKTSNTSTAGTSSVIDGPSNSAAMNDASHPAAQFCEGLTIGGFSDWYMPAKNELEVCYFNLKPTTDANTTFPSGSGINPNAVPSRGSNYPSGGPPTQTTAAAFIVTTGAEAFTADSYWSSTEYSSTYAWQQYFSGGKQAYNIKADSIRVRAIRRVAV
jgi:hypothetical protein